MNEDGYYYLHTNGDLIWKRSRPEMDVGGFVAHVWAVDAADRSSPWMILIEGLAAGASLSRVRELAEKWGCDGPDLVNFLARHTTPTQEQSVGLKMFIKGVLLVDAHKWMDWLASTPNGQIPDFQSMPTAA